MDCPESTHDETRRARGAGLDAAKRLGRSRLGASLGRLAHCFCFSPPSKRRRLRVTARVRLLDLQFDLSMHKGKGKQQKSRALLYQAARAGEGVIAEGRPKPALAAWAAARFLPQPRALGVSSGSQMLQHPLF